MTSSHKSTKEHEHHAAAVVVVVVVVVIVVNSKLTLWHNIKAQVQVSSGKISLFELESFFNINVIDVTPNDTSDLQICWLLQ